MGDGDFIVSRGRQTVNSWRDRAEVQLLLRKMHFPLPRIAANALYSQRAGTGAEECAVLFGCGPGGAGPAAFFGPALSCRCRRFPALRRYCEELAAARRLWRDRLGPDCAHAFPASGI